jgi:uroporphyrinogen decarboxylase
MFNPILENPTPDFDQLMRILKGEEMPRRVPLVDLRHHPDVMKIIVQDHMGQQWVELCESPDLYHKQIVQMYYHLGYDYVASAKGVWLNLPKPKERVTADTAALSKGKNRVWTEEGIGIIATWEDFEKIPWDQITADITPYEYTAPHVLPGMKIIARTRYFADIFEKLLGLEGLSYMLYDDPELVETVFQVWGEKMVDHMETIMDMDAIGAVFHGDDMGHKTGTLISPDDLKRLVIPWLKRFAEIAHAHGKPFFLHSDGNLYKGDLMDVLIDEVKIDGFHSFQDIIMSAVGFKARFGTRVAILGGIDIDNLVRMKPDDLRAYIRNTIEVCMQGGRFGVGCGNIVTNYIPIENYFMIIDEARRWQP